MSNVDPMQVVELKQVLIDAGYPLVWVSRAAKNVSRVYFHHESPYQSERDPVTDRARYRVRDLPGILAVAERHYAGRKR